VRLRIFIRTDSPAKKLHTGYAFAAFRRHIRKRPFPAQSGTHEFDADKLVSKLRRRAHRYFDAFIANKTAVSKSPRMNAPTLYPQFTMKHSFGSNRPI